MLISPRLPTQSWSYSVEDRSVFDQSQILLHIKLTPEVVLLLLLLMVLTKINIEAFLTQCMVMNPGDPFTKWFNFNPSMDKYSHLF